MSAALLAGVGVAAADAGPPADSRGDSTSAPPDPGPARTSAPHKTKPDKTALAKAKPVRPKARPEHPTHRKRTSNPGASAPTDDAGAKPDKPARVELPDRRSAVHTHRWAPPQNDTRVTTTTVRGVAAAEPTDKAVTPTRPTLVGLITSVVFGVLSGFERIVTGPPALPVGSTVSVRSSSLQITKTMSVPANWYYPAGNDPPERMILLQHGFLAIGPMYSYTAARLAEDTHSIVVTPTLTSNPLADGGLWLGGDGMHQSVADLFVGDRVALTNSALAAGYAEQYHLDPVEAVLPRKFALAGHSLGGALVSGAAGHLADNGAADDLVGVILLDGVPTGDQLPNALTKLAAYEEKTGRFIPVREIGAPWNLWNSVSNVNQSLSSARPGHFNGVILSGGVHMDSMQGGNPLIQFLAYVLAGFPLAQNPPAVHELMVSWLDAWFAPRPGVDDDRVPGSTFTIETPNGTAIATVLGTAPAATNRVGAAGVAA